MRQALLFLFLVCSSISSFGQEQPMDSLEHLLWQVEGKAKVDLLNKISKDYWYTAPGTSIEYGRKALVEAQQIEYAKGQADAYNNLGVVYKNLGEYPDAQSYHLKALKIREEIQDTDGVAASCSNLGTVYRYEGKYDEALRFYERCLELDRQSGNKSYISSTLGSIGNVYLQMEEKRDAIRYLTEALSMAQASEDSSRIAVSKVNLGKAYRVFADFNNAEPLLEDALQWFEQTQNSFEIANVLFELAKLAFQQGKLLVSNAYAERALEAAISLNLKPKIQEISELLYQLNELNGNYEQALEYHKMFKTYQDSILNEANIQRANALSYGYELEKREKEIEILNKSRALQQTINWALAGGVLSLFVLAFLLLRGNHLKKRKNLALAQQKQEIERKNSELQLQAEEIISQRDFIEAQNQDLKQQKQQIEKSQKNLERLSAIGQNLTTQLQLSVIIQKVYEQVKLLMPAEAFGIGIIDDLKPRIVFKGFIAKGNEEPVHYDELSDLSKISSVCIKYRKVIFTNDLAAEYSQLVDTPEKQLQTYQPTDAEGEIPQSLIYVPLAIHGNVIGVLTIQSYQKNAYSENDIAMLNTLAVYVAIALDNAKAYQLVRNEKQKITDSIRYAERIQQAILPRENLLCYHFREVFTIFLPKDIISGDFYWYAKLDEYIFLAMVDCTGHGVPGAFMSLIGNSLLNGIIRERRIFEPKEVLKLLHEGVKENLQQEYSENQDGMDMTLCRFNGKELAYAGAKGKLFLSRNGNVEILRTDRINIGGSYMQKSTVEFQQFTRFLETDDVLYLTTDGYIDAVNPQRRRFSTPQLAELLASLSEDSLEVQRTKILRTLEEFKQGTPQRDDITMIGVKF